MSSEPGKVLLLAFWPLLSHLLFIIFLFPCLYVIRSRGSFPSFCFVCLSQSVGDIQLVYQICNRELADMFDNFMLVTWRENYFPFKLFFNSSIITLQVC